MTDLDFPTHREQNFEAEATWHGPQLRVFFRGSAELAVNESLGPILARLHTEALRLQASEVVINLGELQFMNSSCFKQFVTWLSEAQVSSAKPYTFRFITNPRMRWQKASLAAMSCFAPDLVKIETIPT